MRRGAAPLGRLLAYALFRWESAVLIAATLLLAALAWVNRALPMVPGSLWLTVLALGAAAEGLLILSSILDPASRAAIRSADQLPLPRPPRLQTERLREQIDQALDYYRQIQEATDYPEGSPLRNQFGETLSQIRSWLRAIYRLADRLDLYHQQSERLTRDRQRAAAQRAELGERLKRETNPRCDRPCKRTWRRWSSSCAPCSGWTTPCRPPRSCAWSTPSRPYPRSTRKPC